MPKELTHIQRRIFEFLIDHRNNFGMPPTLAEISRHFNYKNRSTVQQHLQAIEKKGYIKRNPKIARGLELTATNELFINHKIIGEVAAGNPLTIYPDEIDTIELPTIANIPHRSFILRVKGDSLKDAYIFNGDLVIVNPDLMPKNGDFIVAVLDDSAVIKRFYKKNNIIELHSENPEFEPIIVKNNHQAFKVVGIVVGMYRKMVNKVI